jgi:hypothetical protein
MLHFITKIINVNSYKIVCEFNSEEVREIDFTTLVEKYKTTNPLFLGRLADFTFFKNVQLDTYGTLVWNNEIDFCPDVLYSMSRLVKEQMSRLEDE